MKISLIDVDGHHFPNLALCKIAGFYKATGHTVDWYSPLWSRPDKIFASKVFTFSPDYTDYSARDPEPIKGGTGYDPLVKLPDEIENFKPDFSIYPDEIMRNPKTGNLQAFGFLTRGCIRNCPWCIVPKKEGAIKPVRTIEEITQGRKEAVLMDNNFLAAPEDFVSEQLQKIAREKIAVDFNQALDARLVTPKNARLLAACKWIRFIRFACDTSAQIEPVKRAVSLIRESGNRKFSFSVYLLIQEIADAEKRLREMVKLDVSPFAQPYRDFTNEIKPTKEQKDFAAFANVKGGKLCLKMKFSQYQHGSI